MNDQNTGPRQAPPGWFLQTHRDTFSAHSGPFHFRDRADKRPGVGFFAEPRHANLGGIVHGGALMTLADMSLWDICRREVGDFRAVTLTVTADFIGAGPVGEFIEATGEMIKAGKSILFARGLVTAKGKTLLSFSGALKRID